MFPRHAERKTRTRQLCCAALLFAGSLLLQQQVAAQAMASQDQLKLHFEGGLLEENTAEMLAVLLDRKLVKLVPYINASSADPAQLTRDELQWPDGIVTDVLSRSLCRQNAHNCTVAGQRVWWRLQKKTGTAVDPEYVCGAPDLPAYVLCLPDVQVDAYLTSKRVRVDPRLSALPHQVVSSLRGCDKYDAACKFIVEHLNPGLKTRQRDGIATMMLPVKAVTITLDADKDRRSQIHSAQTDLISALREKNNLTKASADIRVTTPLQLNLDAAGPGTPDDTGPSPLQRMSYTAGGPPLPSSLGPVVVGVWDGPTDTEHCALKRAKSSAIVYELPALPLEAISAGPRGPCGSVREMLRGPRDHATFVMSLIAGSPINHQPLGADLQAGIWHMEYLRNNLNEPDPIMLALGKKLDVSVINISQDYDASPTAIQSALHYIMLSPDGRGADYVFVVAAGNKGQTFGTSQRCLVVPACWSQELPAEENTIISVIALDRSGRQVLASSNRGTAFDVAAIGDTTGAVYGNAIANGSGTSYAVPYVSALASMLYQHVERRSRKINPMRVKHRILFTSTFVDGLESAMRFGLIDYRRALDFSQDVLLLRQGACPGQQCTMRGDALRSGTLTLDVAYDIDGKRLEKQTFDMTQVKRIQATTISTGERRFYVVVRQNKILTRYHDARIGNSFISFTGQGNKTSKIALADVDDYTSCSFNKHCDGDL